MGKFGTSWDLMKENSMKWAEDAKIAGFKGSDGQLNGALARHRLKRINIHSDKDNLLDE